MDKDKETKTQLNRLSLKSTTLPLKNQHNCNDNYYHCHYLLLILVLPVCNFEHFDTRYLIIYRSLVKITFPFSNCIWKCLLGLGL